MANVLFEIDGDALAPAPAGQTFDHIDIVVIDATGTPQTVRGVAGTNASGAVNYTATMTITAPGAFSYIVGAVDTANAAMGTTVNGSDTVGDGGGGEAGKFFQPSGVKVTVTA